MGGGFSADDACTNAGIRSCLAPPPGFQESICRFDPAGSSGSSGWPGVTVTEEQTVDPHELEKVVPEKLEQSGILEEERHKKKRAQLSIDLQPSPPEGHPSADGQPTFPSGELLPPVPFEDSPGSPTSRGDRVLRTPSRQRRPSIVSSHCSIPETDGALELSYEVVLFGAAAEELADEACGLESPSGGAGHSETPTRQLVLRITDEHTAIVSLHPYHNADLPDKIFESLRTTVFVFIVNMQDSIGDPEYLKDIGRRVREVRARCARRAAESKTEVSQPVCCCWLLEESGAEHLDWEARDGEGPSENGSEISPPESLQSPRSAPESPPVSERGGALRVVSGALPSLMDSVQAWAQDLKLKIVTCMSSREELTRAVIHAMLCEFINGMDKVTSLNTDASPASPTRKVAIVLGSMKKALSVKRKKLGQGRTGSKGSKP
mmetsp:Transcript_44378/g.105095  ORF Transcript_44378/g.105095 Transcript_44378/m.105095 type:complete len:435 (-) Transcript_44378:7-1311(-)